MKVDITGRTAELTAECERLRKRESDYKHQIHMLRSRCEALVREMEGMRAGRSATPTVRHFDCTKPEWDECQPEE
jgi:hypothetical protein